MSSNNFAACIMWPVAQSLVFISLECVHNNSKMDH